MPCACVCVYGTQVLADMLVCQACVCVCVLVIRWHAMQKANGEREHANVYADINFFVHSSYMRYRSRMRRVSATFCWLALCSTIRSTHILEAKLCVAYRAKIGRARAHTHSHVNQSTRTSQAKRTRNASQQYNKHGPQPQRHKQHTEISYAELFQHNNSASDSSDQHTQDSRFIHTHTHMRAHVCSTTRVCRVLAKSVLGQSEKSHCVATITATAAAATWPKRRAGVSERASGVSSGSHCVCVCVCV